MASARDRPPTSIELLSPSAVVCTCGECFDSDWSGDGASIDFSAMWLFLCHHASHTMAAQEWPKKPHGALSVMIRCIVCKNSIDINDYKQHLHYHHSNADLQEIVESYGDAIESVDASSVARYECVKCLEKSEFNQLSIPSLIQHDMFHEEATSYELYVTCQLCLYPVPLRDSIGHATFCHHDRIRSPSDLADCYAPPPPPPPPPPRRELLFEPSRYQAIGGQPPKKRFFSDNSKTGESAAELPAAADVKTDVKSDDIVAFPAFDDSRSNPELPHKFCTLCDERFATISDLGLHLENVHSIRRPLQSTTAPAERDELYSTHKGSSVSQQSHGEHSRDTAAEGSDAAYCASPVIEVVFDAGFGALNQEEPPTNRNNDLDAEESDQDDAIRSFGCPDCEKAFSLKSSLLLHESVAHPEEQRRRRLGCDACGRIFANPAQRRAHRKGDCAGPSRDYFDNGVASPHFDSPIMPPPPPAVPKPIAMPPLPVAILAPPPPRMLSQFVAPTDGDLAFFQCSRCGMMKKSSHRSLAPGSRVCKFCERSIALNAGFD